MNFSKNKDAKIISDDNDNDDHDHDNDDHGHQVSIVDHLPFCSLLVLYFCCLSYLLQSHFTLLPITKSLTRFSYVVKNRDHEIVYLANKRQYFIFTIWFSQVCFLSNLYSFFSRYFFFCFFYRDDHLNLFVIHNRLFSLHACSIVSV